jgi:hypothetical protein
MRRNAMRTKVVLAVFLLGGISGSALGFTVSTLKTPVGHEELVRRAVEAAHRSSAYGSLLSSRLERLDLNHAASVGATWVALRGFSLAEFGSFATVALEHLRCWEVVANTHDSVQYDHFLRKRGEVGADGWKTTVAGAKARFEVLFKMAVSKKKVGAKIDVIDYIGHRHPKHKGVSEGYFLLGRAMHLLQDSFSEEHVTRSGFSPDDHAIVNVNTRVCTPGATKHAFQDGLSVHYGEECAEVDDWGLNGDVIWTSKRRDKLKPSAKLAVVATTELIEAFVQALGADGSETRIRNILNPFTTRRD